MCFFRFRVLGKSFSPGDVQIKFKKITLQKCIVILSILSVVYGLTACISNAFANEKHISALIAPVFLAIIVAVLSIISFFKSKSKRAIIIAMLTSVISVIAAVLVYIIA